MDISNMTKRLLLFLLIASLSACSQYRSTKSQATSGYYETGIASYYADKYQGRQTANGERFDQNALTAAHKKLRFGTRVKVTNLNNGKSVIVRINDRGPFVKGRVIDLSKTAFVRIADQRLGVVKVQVKILK